MPISIRSAGGSTLCRLVYTLVALWMAGVALRSTLLAIPPIIPQLQQGLGLSQTDIGIVSSLPLLLFAVVSIPGAALIARFGTVRALLFGLLITAVAGALRALSPGATVLFLTTFVMGAGIAVMQPALPALVRDWAPRHIGLATAVYSNGMLSAEGISAAATLPLILPWLGGSWRWTLVFWSAPVIVAMVLVAHRDWQLEHAAPAGLTGKAVQSEVRRRWWPNWHDAETWKLGFILGGSSGIFFGVNAFLPGYLSNTGQGQLITGALASLNASQIPATIVLFFFAQRIALKKSAYVIFGALATLSVVGLFTMSGYWVLLWSTLMGVSCAFVITLGLTLPALLSEPGDVQRLAGGMFTISYVCALLAPVLGGVGWDLTAIPEVAFAPAVLCGLIIVGVGTLLRFKKIV